MTELTRNEAARYTMCRACHWTGHEEGLTLARDMMDGDWVYACPQCMTDEHLTAPKDGGAGD